MSSLAKQRKVLALLGLFSPSQRAMIFDVVKNTSIAGLETDLSFDEADASKPLPILSFIPANTTPAEVEQILMAFSVMACHALTKEKDEDYWKDMLMEVMHLSDSYASKLAGEIATQDSYHDITMTNKDTQESETITQWLGRMWKHIRHPLTDEANLPTEKDYDVINEMNSLGKAMKELLARVRLGLGTSANMIGDNFLMNLIQVAESGDIDPVGDVEMGRLHRGIYTAIKSAPYGDVEEGALTRFALRQAKKVRQVLATNATGPNNPIKRSRLVQGIAANRSQRRSLKSANYDSSQSTNDQNDQNRNNFADTSNASNNQNDGSADFQDEDFSTSDDLPINDDE
jgi:hypothetical protein